ncbi:DUF2779 domain-containing protein [Luteolibacter marinus]|uniref:DUF2779 domain-containing protein n=1 Tax=Luteolibacter marinus TaxID=2776705 RepID=UPI0018673B86|nr:DUF2779 domain-containing protein [Luteolibacter marinus]
MRQLSKSKIIAYRQCPRRLWLELHRPELKDDNGNQAVFAIGNQVGEVARGIYDAAGKGELIDIEAMGWDAAYERTASWLAGEQAPLFEAALRIPGALALADVMLSDGGGSWRMIEVKSTASVKDYQRDDIAIQAYVAKQAGVPLSSVSLAHIDTSFVYQGDGDYRGLLFEVDLSGEAFARETEVAGWIAEAQEVAALPEEPEVEPGPQCWDPFECGFCAHCHRDLPTAEFPLTSFYRMRGTKRDELVAAGYRDIREVPDEHLSETNSWIKELTAKGETHFDAAGAAAELARHPGEPSFLDFETIAFAVPIWAGTSPYKQIPFQFSLHHRDASGGGRHAEFLDTTGADPRRPLAEALVAACGSKGPIYAYNAKFEKGVIAGLAQHFPDLAVGLMVILSRLVDLEPIARRNFYAPSQHGSWSLKAVLPAICPELDYGRLEGVQNGDLAQQAYLEAIGPDTTEERRGQIRRQLLDYCELDTLALVRMWEVFSG